MKIGSKLKAAREDMDLSQEQVSSKIPMNQSSYSKIERDLQEPNLEQLRMICKILKLNPIGLLELEEIELFNDKDLRLLDDIKKAYKKHYE